MSGDKHPLRRKLPALLGGAFLVLFSVAAVLMVKNFIASAEKPEKPRVQRISLVKPPPPRDLPKPPEPEKIEQEQPKEEISLADAPPTPDAPQDEGPPPGEQLGLDAEGGAGGDAFGLAARKGGRDITTLGSGGGDRQGWYGRAIARHFEDGLRRARQLQGTSYQVVVNVWFDPGGQVRRVTLARGSGDSRTDQLVQEEILGLPPLRESLPEDLPQPVRIRVASRA
ncbi:MAG: TonB C-terminal domain-containing protein [Thiobacillaceae bacterium]|jgi:protein TonB|nr:TonB C-terminal domain-containing protein [Thiobacillaceae bacterium]